jgi:UDP-2,4-diacetamido-2,4,6-trideoxy-beta-L-altropyranose hydrolase
MNRLIIRADADHARGTGHVMRTLALAQEWHQRGGPFLYVGRILSKALEKRIEEEGGAVRRLDGVPDRDRDRRTVHEEAGQGGWAVLDGYDFNADDEEDLRSAGCRVLSVDDYGTRARVCADLLLNQNACADRIEYDCSPGTTVLRGPRYALLRKSFRGQPGRPARHPRHGTFVMFGGSDAAGLTGRVLSSLAASDDPPRAGVAVLGPLANAGADAKRAIERLGSGWSLESDAGDERLTAIISNSETAIAACGTSIWELAAFGVPTLAFAVAENQKQVLSCLVGMGAAADAGPPGPFREREFAASFDRFRSGAGALARMRDLGPAMVDGHGARRVADAMLAADSRAEAELRPADAGDAFLLWGWANDAATRAQSFQSEAIPWDDHRRWLARRLTSEACRIYILEWKTIPVGVVRYDRIDAAMARISFAVDRDFRGQGLGLKLLEMSRPLASRDLAVESFEAETLPENAPSRKVFRRAGFLEEPGARGGRPRIRFVFNCRQASRIGS